MIFLVWGILILSVLIFCGMNSGHTRVTPHPDSMKGSFYEISNRKDS